MQQAIPHGHDVVPAEPKRQKHLSQGQRRAPANLDPTPQGLDLGRLHVKERRLRADLQGLTGTLEHADVLHTANTKLQGLRRASEAKAQAATWSSMQSLQ